MFNRLSRAFRYYSTTNDTKSKVPMYMVTAGFAAGIVYFLGKPDEKNPPQSGNVLAQYLKRAKAKVVDTWKGMEEPVFDKFLPPRKQSDPHTKDFTLVVDLDRFLVCHIFDPVIGKWKVAKRPGSEVFLFYMAQLYEVVVFSALSDQEGDAIVKKLDPFGCISYPLFRFATTHRNGVYFKDITRLNRDLSKVIVLGHDKKGFGSPENMISVNEWNGDPNDHQIEKYIDFLEALAYSRTSDFGP